MDALHTGPLKILIADDSTATRFLMMTSLVANLNLNRSQFSETNDGSKAIEMVSDHHFDLVLMDYNMPDVSGLEAVKAIRETGNPIPILMVTAENKQDFVVAAVSQGVDDFIVKPIDQVILAQKVANLLKIPFRS